MSVIEKFTNAKYYNTLVPDEFFNQNFVDFTSLNRYGVVDTNNNLIIPREDKMKPLSGSPNVEVLSFVSLAFETMLTEIQEKVEAGEWEKDSRYAILKPQLGFRSPITKYDDFIGKQFVSLKPLIYKNRSIVDFKSFLQVFHDHIAKRKYKFPFTMMGFLEQQNDPGMTGLQIEFEKQKKNDVELKIQYAGDPAFKRFLLLAEKHGFYVNRNTPWIIMANINSPAMQIYASQDAGINIGTRGLIKRYFDPAIKYTFDFFTQYLIGTYNAVATDEPEYQYLVTDSESCTGYKKVQISRQIIFDSEPEISQNSILLELIYFFIRFGEAFDDRKKLKIALREYKLQQKLKNYPFAEIVERIAGPAKNSSIKFYGPTAATSITSFDFPFEADEFAAKIGCVGSHQMPNGRFMPCKTHEEYISLTSR